MARYLVRLTVPRRGGWHSWRAVSGTFEHRLAGQGSDVVLTPRIDRELRGRGRDYVRVVVVAAVLADDVAEALDLAWWAFREAAGDTCSVVATHPNLIGLARVSTDAQDAQLQHDALNEAGCGRIFEEKISTRRPSGPASPLRSTTCAPATLCACGS